MKRTVATLVVTGLCTAYIIWKIDVRNTVHLLVHGQYGWWFLSLAIMVLSVWPMAWRWRRLLAARGVHESLGWLVRAYFVGYAAGQVLPTSLGGDATRIFETSRRHVGAGGDAAATVLLERLLGGVATLCLAAVGFALAVGQYDVGGYLWVELALVVGAVLVGVVVFSTRLHPLLQVTRPLLRRVRLERPLRAAYLSLHAYRNDLPLLGSMFALTLAVAALRVLAIWAAGKAAGVDLSPRPYYVMGPLLFLVMLVPFTINGLAVRESFFVSFLGGLGVDPDAAFATGFLFFVVTIALSLPGALIVAWEGVRSTRVS
jgi:glycosyltransferase 2 family protein